MSLGVFLNQDLSEPCEFIIELVQWYEMTWDHRSTVSVSHEVREFTFISDHKNRMWKRTQRSHIHWRLMNRNPTLNSTHSSKNINFIQCSPVSKFILNYEAVQSRIYFCYAVSISQPLKCSNLACYA